MLRKANMTNSVLNISGCLFFHNGKFVQLLEGEEEKVRPLFEVIKSDPRHTAITVLSSETAKHRLFNGWNVVFNHINRENQVQQKRIHFESVYHSSNAGHTPGNSKLVLWHAVQEILNEESVFLNGKRH